MTKSSQNEKEKKGGKDKQTSVKSGSTKDKSKDKKKKSAPELVHDAPIRRLLGSVHVPLQSLTRRGQRVDVLCDFGVLHTEEAPQTLEKDPRKKIKEDKKKKEERSASGSKGKGKGKKEREVDVLTDNSEPVQLVPVTVEFSVELEKWESAAEALLLSHQIS
ncbi:hypothetical protein E3U43_000942 [Larimichthys crocea]|uniref:Uncharacterized protein n=1 Tax=Larimichthys crocea TaxID=215358 RepID=A0ACD3QA87_LARCR|nr:hypothetical protein E3U43_000942 [Larimichthys crocea]